MCVGDGTTVKTAPLAVAEALSEWTDVAVTWDGTNAWGYVNGVQAAGGKRLVGFADAGRGELLIGATALNLDKSFWKGWIDDVRVYRRSLSAAELGAVNDWLGDADADGLRNGREYGLGTNPRNADSDGDGVEDGVEVDAGMDPLAADSDGDGMPDGWEIANGLDPLADDAAKDPDADGLPNGAECAAGTDPRNADSDGDGLPDGWEAENTACARGTAGFGSLVNATGNMAEMTNNVVATLAGAVQPGVVMVDGEAILTARKGYTSEWHNVVYSRYAEEAWLDLRYKKLRYPPSGLSAERQGTQIRLSWNPVRDAERYEVLVAREEDFRDFQPWNPDLLRTEEPEILVDGTTLTGQEVWGVRVVYWAQHYDDAGKENGGVQRFGEWAVSGFGEAGPAGGGQDEIVTLDGTIGKEGCGR